MKTIIKKKIQPKHKNIIIIGAFILLLIILNFTLKRDEVSNVELFFKGIVNKIQEILYIKIDKEIDVSKKVLEEENKSLKNEIDDLKKLLELNKTMTDYVPINATVLYRNVGYWYETITVNKGKKNNVKKGMLVMTDKGIIGRIINVSNYSSDIKLLTSSDENSRITVAIEMDNSIIYGLISRYDYINKELLIDNITSYIEYKDNMKVITSGLTDSYPKGILIGYVNKIEKDKTGLSYVVRVKPNADFNSIKYVMILGSD